LIKGQKLVILKRMIDRLLTIKEIAKILRVSERFVLRYIESSRLEVSRIGQWRIKQSDLNKFLEKYSNVKTKSKKKLI